MNGPALLLVSLSNIGDAIMTTPVLEAMHALYPNARIDIVADRRSSEIFEHCPYRGRILHKNKDERLRGVGSLLRELRSVAYELIVDLRTDFLPYLLRGGRRLLKWRARPYGPHAVEQHMGVIAVLHGGRSLPATTIWLGPGDFESAHMALAEMEGVRRLALGAGANLPAKTWPARHFNGLIAELKGEFDSVVLLGDRADRALSQVIAANSALPCLDLCGCTTIRGAAAVLAQTDAFVGNDSGLGHLASAVGTPSLTLFGPGDPTRYRPWGRCADWLVEPDAQLAGLSPATVAQRFRQHLRELAQGLSGGSSHHAKAV